MPRKVHQIAKAIEKEKKKGKTNAKEPWAVAHATVKKMKEKKK